MTERTKQNHFTNKLHFLESNCIYGLEHFCDGTPNKSVDENTIPKPPCPNFTKCEIRRVKVFKTLKEDDYD